ncbi:hypothetical protein DPEC_G00100230 [Dallia pectoralis]|uniref:Uncharacterized protein n=1 Tax=Dallia pectoralis TaxID=75939 RepID=A0ACC2GWE2_DALPE|nr:hypothetical protein DPEC_G00100230 [Dallia pectoralis]
MDRERHPGKQAKSALQNRRLCPRNRTQSCTVWRCEPPWGGGCPQPFVFVSLTACGNRPVCDIITKWPHQQTDNHLDRVERRHANPRGCNIRGGQWQLSDPTAPHKR